MINSTKLFKSLTNEFAADFDELTVQGVSVAGSTDITQEREERIAADNLLQGEIDDEETARIAGDNGLDARLDIIEGKLYSDNGNEFLELSTGLSKTSQIKLYEYNPSTNFYYGFNLNYDGSPNDFTIKSHVAGLNTTRLLIPRNTDSKIQILNSGLNTSKILRIDSSNQISSSLYDDSDITDTRDRLTVAEEDIDTNTSNISTNTSNISTNTSNISTNTSNIDTNTSNIASNTSNIATNTSNIASNTSNIASNTSNIATNTSNIATNTGNLTGISYSSSIDTTDISNNLQTERIMIDPTIDQLYANDLNKSWTYQYHNTFNGSIGSNYPLPECGNIWSNNSGGGQLKWAFYQGVLKDVASSSSSSLRFDWGKASNIHTPNDSSNTQTFDRLMTLRNGGQLGIGLTPSVSDTYKLRVAGDTILDGNLRLLNNTASRYLYLDSNNDVSSSLYNDSDITDLDDRLTSAENDIDDLDSRLTPSTNDRLLYYNNGLQSTTATINTSTGDISLLPIRMLKILKHNYLAQPQSGQIYLDYRQTTNGGDYKFRLIKDSDVLMDYNANDDEFNFYKSIKELNADDLVANKVGCSVQMVQNGTYGGNNTFGVYGDFRWKLSGNTILLQYTNTLQEFTFVEYNYLQTVFKTNLSIEQSGASTNMLLEHDKIELYDTDVSSSSPIFQVNNLGRIRTSTLYYRYPTGSGDYHFTQLNTGTGGLYQVASNSSNQTTDNAQWGKYGVSYAINFYRNVLVNGSVVHTSDKRIKRDIEDNSKPSLDIINKIQLKEYNYKYRSNTDKKQIGVIAQQIKTDIDDVYGTDIVGEHDEITSLETTNGEINDLLSIKKDKMFLHLIGAVQELTKQNKELLQRIEVLEGN